MSVGKKIRQIRQEKGLTQKKLGELCGIAEPTIRRYEAETLNPKLTTVEKIASALGISAFDLMGAEYWDKKYPDLAKKSKEYEGFIDYLNSLGYIVKDVCSTEESDFTSGETHSVELIKDGKSFIIEDDEFEELQQTTKDMIAFRLWQKFQGKK